MEFHERIQKIIDTYEEGSKSKFAAKTGMHNNIYNILKPGYKPGKKNIDRIISAYPRISAEWITSDIGNMDINTTIQPKDKETDKLRLTELPDNLTAHQVLSYILKYSGTETLAKLSVKLNVNLSDLNRVFNGEKPMGRLALKIHKTFPELPLQWIRTGVNPSKSKSTPEKKTKPETEMLQMQTPDIKPAPVKTMLSADDKSYIQALELQLKTILKINEGLLSDYQKTIEINHRLNNIVLELSEKVAGFQQKV